MLWLRHVYALVLVVISWAIFAVEDLGHLGAYLKDMLGFGAGFSNPTVGYYAAAYGVVLLIACVAATPLGKNLWHKLPEKVRMVVLPLLLAGGLILSTAYLVDATYNPFLYFRF